MGTYQLLFLAVSRWSCNVSRLANFCLRPSTRLLHVQNGPASRIVHCRDGPPGLAAHAAWRGTCTVKHLHCQAGSTSGARNRKTSMILAGHLGPSAVFFLLDAALGLGRCHVCALCPSPRNPRKELPKRSRPLFPSSPPPPHTIVPATRTAATATAAAQGVGLPFPQADVAPQARKRLRLVRLRTPSSPIALSTASIPVAVAVPARLGPRPSPS